MIGKNEGQIQNMAEILCTTVKQNRREYSVLATTE